MTDQHATDQRAADRYVVLADVVGSRGIEDRTAFEADLEAAFDSLNREYADSLATPLSRMKGVDEFGCVLEALSPLPDVISELLARTHPVRARFGVATGEIDVGLGRESVAEMDGPAFHAASALLDDLEAQELYVGIDADRPADDLAAAALNFLVVHQTSLTERQVQVALAYERHGTQAEAAADLGITQQAVSKALNDAGYERAVALRRTIERGLEGCYGG